MAFADNSISRHVYSTWEREREREWAEIIIFKIVKSGQFNFSMLYTDGETDAGHCECCSCRLLLHKSKKMKFNHFLDQIVRLQHPQLHAEFVQMKKKKKTTRRLNGFVNFVV